MTRFEAILLGACALVTACGSPSTSGVDQAELLDPNYSAFPYDSLVGKVVFQDAGLDGAWQLWRVGADLLLAPGSSDSLVAVISLQDERRRGFVAAYGDGPGELRSVSAISLAPSGRAIAILDPSAHRTLLRPVSHVVAGSGEDSVWGSLRDAYDLALLTDSNSITLGLGDPARVVFRDSKGKRIAGWGNTPGDAAYPLMVRQHAYQSVIILAPDRSKFALLQRHGGRVEVYRANGDSVAFADGPFPFLPRVTVTNKKGTPQFSGGDGLRFGYVGGVATDRLILALFSGHTRGGAAPSPTAGEFVHVFDWNGRLLRIFRLDSSALGVALGIGDSTLYASIDDSIPTIKRYALPEDLRPQESVRQKNAIQVQSHP